MRQTPPWDTQPCQRTAFLSSQFWAFTPERHACIGDLRQTAILVRNTVAAAHRSDFERADRVRIRIANGALSERISRVTGTHFEFTKKTCVARDSGDSSTRFTSRAFARLRYARVSFAGIATFGGGRMVTRTVVHAIRF
jgi:hypothetical protein